jgi:hypothetical protein
MVPKPMAGHFFETVDCTSGNESRCDDTHYFLRIIAAMADTESRRRD